jgi:hypothetical protein
VVFSTGDHTRLYCDNADDLAEILKECIDSAGIGDYRITAVVWPDDDYVEV